MKAHFLYYKQALYCSKMTKDQELRHATISQRTLINQRPTAVRC